MSKRNPYDFYELANYSRRLNAKNLAKGRDLKNWLLQDLAEILDELKAISPKDTGKFAGAWGTPQQCIKHVGSRTIITISNDTDYGVYLEKGGVPGKRPWPLVEKDGVTPKEVSKSGKTRRARDPITGKIRVWAGGLNPGGDDSIGGVARQVLGRDGSGLKSIIESHIQTIRDLLRAERRGRP